MSRVSRLFAFFGLLGLFCAGGFAAGQQIADSSRPTGLKPIDAAEFKKIRETWPRVGKVHLNPLGLQRINSHRAKLGKPPLEVSVVKPIGREIEGAVQGPTISILAATPNYELLGQLPASVDNSLQTFFPPIEDQEYLNACLPFATTYYQLSYMEALVREPQTLTLYSPKWTYNMINGGLDAGSYPTDAYGLLEKHGAVTLAEFPYDTDYRAWCLTTSAWRSALGARINPAQYIYDTDIEVGMEQIKEALNNGYILVFGTYIMSWQGQFIMDDPATSDDDPEVGKAIGYFLNGLLGSHAMTIVGYNDEIWADVNGNAIVDDGEKGAFKIANSWGSTWQDSGFIWLAYDALREVSAVPDGPSEGRTTAFQQNAVFVMTPRDGYSPSMVAEFTVNHAKRGQMGISLGISETSDAVPAVEWYPAGLAWQGGDYAFDGSMTAIDGTFVLDFTDLLSVAGVERKYYLGLWDNAGGDVATLKAFKIVDLTTDTETDSITGLPITADGSPNANYAFTQYTYSGATANQRPVLMYAWVGPTIGTVSDTFHYEVYYSDPDGDSAAIHSIYVDDVQHDMTEYPTYPGWYFYDTGLPVGAHSYRFYFVDSRGEAAIDPAAGTYSGPVVTLIHFVEQPADPTGETMPVRGTSYVYSTLGSVCSEVHDIQYRFDWGDGSFSDWLPVGQTSASHAWAASGSFAVKAQARCAVDPVIVSPWSAWLAVTVPAAIPFSQSFVSSGFPAGWIQQNIGQDVYNGWVLSPSVHAGGQPYEMRCTFEDVVPGVTRLITPPINTLGYTQLRLRFRHFLDAWTTGGSQLLIQTSTDRVNWTDEVWTLTTTTEDIGPEMVDTTLVHNLNDETTFVAFVITGDLYYFDDWYIDDIGIAAPGKLRLFVKSASDSGIWMNTMTTDEAFEGWELQPGGTSTTPTVGVFNNLLHLIVKDIIDDKMWYRSLDGTGAWGDWSQLSGTSPSPASMAAFNNKLYLVVRGSNDRIYYRSMDASGIWGSWNVLAVGATTEPPVVAAFNGKLHLVVKSSINMDIWWNSMDATETWAGWQQISGLTPNPAAITAYNNRLYLFVRGSDDRIYYRSLDTEGMWGEWTGMYGWTTISPTVTSFNGKLYLIVKASVGDGIWMRSMDAEEMWGDWSQIPGATTIPMAVAIF